MTAIGRINEWRKLSAKTMRQTEEPDSEARNEPTHQLDNS
eukprot:CAMPEP_0184690856 /NCGR_PEP_ID=MMETSP0312-20130426/31472_1 /TAXON_ID=31354 /ORGANISM="Compsopogon coeruleus, Strain SAG 36.94" /LENGTH=39 /DNA_ID= /DNA_START= /DNA_END= /DNA_ORIENTATION=